MKEILVKYTNGEGWYRSKLFQCKDCKWWSDEGVVRKYPICIATGREMKAFDFCSKAERKEE